MAPCVVCFDDAHMNFPSGVSRMSDPGGAAATARMVVELEVQLQQLADMQVGRCLSCVLGLWRHAPSRKEMRCIAKLGR